MRPIRLALSNDYHVVLAGLIAMLADYPDQVEIIDATTSPGAATKPDVILYDTFGKLADGDDKLRRIVAANDAKVVVYSWESYPAALATEHGAAGHVFKGLAPSELVRAVVSIHRGDVPQVVTKTYIRTPYRKIGVDSRSQAVLWALRNGLPPGPGTSS